MLSLFDCSSTAHNLSTERQQRARGTMTIDVISNASEAGPSVPVAPPTPFESLTRPPFRPTTVSPVESCILTTAEHPYTPTFSHPVQFNRTSFFSALKDLTLHPERNSSLILRADPLPAREPTDDVEITQAGLERHEEIRVRLMPKQVKRDGRLDQRVSFYEDEAGRGVVLMVPEVKSVEDVPFYHPPVQKLAFIYEPTEQPEMGHQELTDEVPMRGTLSIAYLPFPASDALETLAPELASANGAVVVPESPNSPFLGTRSSKSPRKRSPLASTPRGSSSDEPIKPPAVVLENEGSSSPSLAQAKSQAETTMRTVRTCKLLLERVYKHAYGNMMGYQKRVLHDVSSGFPLVPWRT
jgi:tRNASer (uridine44-2'-O)-methyltransferase